jgi:hypothetical protein
MNDVFVSYSSADRPWATQLANDLKALGVACFLDTVSIRKGDGWERQILQSLRDSRHLVVIWSSKSGQSDWVNQELYRFKAEIDPNGTGQTGGRLLYAINLEGQNATLSAYQQYNLASLQDAYRNSPAGTITLGAVAQQDWTRMVREIADATTTENARMQVYKVVFAMTKATLDADPVRPPRSVPQLDDFLAKVGVGSGNLSDRYGAKPDDWKPYGTTETIADVLNDLLHDPIIGVNAKLRELNRPEIRWVSVDVVNPPTLPESTVRKLSAGACLMVIDPISIFSFDMFRRFVELKPCFANPSAAIVLMTPFKAHPTLSFLRESLIEYIRPNLAWYCEPIPFQPAYANCSINVSESWEIRRLVLASLGRQPEVASGSPSSSNPFTQV